MARMKSSGERGLPWRSPHLWVKGVPGQPLSDTREEEEASKIDIMSRQRCLKPKADNTSRRYPQWIESKAFAISSFKKIRSFLR